MQVSVVIPVYQAAPFISQAVQSALAQPETGEVILVEDGSPDDSYKICEELSQKNEKVRLFTHPGHANQGPGASRNLGMQNARHPYISLLDGDDFMLPQRFATTRKVLQRHPDADGVYEAVGTFFNDEASRARWTAMHSSMLTTVREPPVAPEQLFYRMGPIGDNGHIHTNGWTFSRTLLEKVEGFNPSLPLHQDTDFFMRLTMAGRFLPGEITKPVAMRRVHTDNRITAKRPPRERFINRLNMWLSTLSWAERNAPSEQTRLILSHTVALTLDRKAFADPDTGPGVGTTQAFLWLLQRKPTLLRNPFFYQFIIQHGTARLKNVLRGLAAHASKHND